MLALAVLLEGLLSSGRASAAAVPTILPSDGGYRVKWFQSDGLTPDPYWQIEMRPALRRGSTLVISGPLAAQPSCWSVAVPVGEPANVRIRSVAGTQVSGWTASASVPRPNGSYVLKWFQPDGVTGATSWDLEITPTRAGSTKFVVSALVRPEPVCWALAVPVSEPVVARIRPVTGTTVAPWSAYTIVPEPGAGVAIAAGVAGSALLARRRVRAHRRGRASDGRVRDL